MPQRLINLKALLQIFAAGLVFGLFLFLQAGTLSWWQGWAYMLSFLVFGGLSSMLYQDSPELLEERRTAAKKAKAWDKPLVFAVVVVLLFCEGARRAALTG